MQKDPFDAVTNASGANTGAATTAIRSLRNNGMSGTGHTNVSFTTRTPTTTCRSEKSTLEQLQDTQKDFVCACFMFSLTPSLTHSLTHTHTLSLSLYCSASARADYACNSEDLQVPGNSEKDYDPDPDSAELSSNCDHESSTSQPAGPASQTAT